MGALCPTCHIVQPKKKKKKYFLLFVIEKYLTYTEVERIFPNVSLQQLSVRDHFILVFSFSNTLNTKCVGFFLTPTSPVTRLLLLSCFSRVRLFATPWTVAYQAPPSVGFSKQEYWSGVPSPSPPVTLVLQFNSVLILTIWN